MRGRVAFDYIVGGWRVRATRRLPFAVAAPGSGAADLTVHLGELPSWLFGLADAEREPWLGDSVGIAGTSGVSGWKLRSGTFFQITYEDGTTFVLDRAGTEVWASWPEALTLEDTVTYLFGPVLGFVLRLRGLQCLHASAFVAAGGAVAIVGDAGYGKSTTVAAFAQRGFPVLSDDTVILREEGRRFRVVPSYPQLKLWSDSTALLFGSPDALQLITPTHPTWDKRYVDLTADGFTFARDSVPLAAVYVLQPRHDGDDAPLVGELPPRARLTALFENTYAAQYVDTAGHAEAFRALARLASTVPVRSVTPHADPTRIGRLCDVILADLARHAPRAAALADR